MEPVARLHALSTWTHAEGDEGAEGDGAERDGALSDCFRTMSDVGALFDYIASNRAERDAKADRSGVDFRVGQVLRHRKFGFRAAVFGWERRPQVDVSSWDGVQGLPSGAEQPFYRMIPDMADCVRLLGGPRGVRYVRPGAIDEDTNRLRAVARMGSEFFEEEDAVLAFGATWQVGSMGRTGHVDNERALRRPRSSPDSDDGAKGDELPSARPPRRAAAGRVEQESSDSDDSAPPRRRRRKGDLSLIHI